jgi:hypothetical protein
MITTIRQLAAHTGVNRELLDQRQKNHPITAKYKVKSGVRHYRNGDLLKWHERCERVINGYSKKSAKAIEEGVDARFNGEPLSSNPYGYNSDICSYCAWAAGWHDAR